MADQAKGRARKPARRYSVALATEIVERTAAGEAWSVMALEEEMPAYSAPYYWAKTRPDFAERWAEARVMAADRKADEAAEIIKRGTPAQQASFLMLQAARMAPDRWGAKARAPEATPRQEVIVVRNFMPVTLADGRVISREIRPDGTYVDEA